MPDETSVELFTVSNGSLSATFTSYGARLVSLHAPDASGATANVVLGYDTLDLYIADQTYLGAVVGRYGNRIAKGRFTLDGKEYQLPQNNDGNSLHGGAIGFDQRVWAAVPLADGVEFSLTSPDGDQGYPGTLAVTVRYTLSISALRIDYTARTDAPTIVNLTNHTYFNLAGSGLILDHEITLPASAYTPVTEALIPTGELAPVEGTPFDLRRATTIGTHIDDDNVQLQRAGGYDHNWVFGAPGEMKLAATLRDPASGRTMSVETTEPGIQFYSGNFVNAARTSGKYQKRAGLCLETQHYPDSPNQPAFPSTVLRPGDTMRSTTIFSFGAEASV